MTISERKRAGSLGFTLSSDANWQKFASMPGNTGLTFLVDVRANQFIFNFWFWYVRVNRNIGAIADSVIRFRYGDLLLQGFEVGSTKAGVELLRPQWRQQPGAYAPDVFDTDMGCGGMVRRRFTDTNAPQWHTPGVYTWQRLLPTPGPELVISGLMTPAQAASTNPTSLC